MRKMLSTALAAWKATPKSKRYLAVDPESVRSSIRRAADQFPDDGLALRVFSRDMPRARVPKDWRATAWNVDSCWMRKGEVSELLPKRLARGEVKDWPAALSRRLVKHHLVDNVRGQTNGYQDANVRRAELRTTITAVRGNRVHIALSGASETTTTGHWPTDGTRASAKAQREFDRGVRTTLRGSAVFDRSEARFVSFELSAVGTRWGRTRYNFRQDDADEAPIGFAVVLDERDPGRRVAPAEFHHYGW